ncbi:MAG: ImmA/IrrE family metallo-endopeptidase [Dictyoglomus sp.]|nr:ImmA/IrrE family metallo-endopeptidase [Dictyoglomus sp.]MCX7941485.1 ImmA/IrrE family metallo-endopeptidase [Dictyoglomaceae bacterium]MDW8189099.1 ImmA/IrrE family metallo-endopeptidase [Dictyoglomus sp.]
MYEELVREILLYFSIGKPPIKPDLIAYGLGLKIILSPSLGNISGFICSFNNSGVILVNKYHPLTRQRFTIAHELGHYFLHHKSFLSFEEDKIMRIQANNFAGTLLLPYFLLERYLYLHPSKISKIFMVSQGVVERRIEFLRRENKI